MSDAADIMEALGRHEAAANLRHFDPPAETFKDRLDEADALLDAAAERLADLLLAIEAVRELLCGECDGLVRTAVDDWNGEV